MTTEYFTLTDTTPYLSQRQVAPAPIANFYAVCRRTATPLDIATQAAMDSSTAWQEVVDAGSYARKPLRGIGGIGSTVSRAVR